MSEERILTLHPEGKNGMNISVDKYGQVKSAILAVLSDDPMIYSDFTAAVRQKLDGTFEGSIPWYVETVKLDLEARGIITHNRKNRMIVAAS